MYPVICQIGPFTIQSYGAMLALAVVICSALLVRDVRRVGISAEAVLDLIFWVVVSGILGARLFYILLNLEYFWSNPGEIIQIQNGGLAFQGSLIAGCITGIIFLKKRNWPFWKTLDIVAPYIALGHAIGRIGCFLNGCCYGRPWEKGIYFPVHQAHLHPTQLYESFSLLLIYFILKRLQTRGLADGKIFVWYLILASLERFVVEFFRADHASTYWGLSVFQIMSLFFLAVAGYVNTRLKSRS